MSRSVAEMVAERIDQEILIVHEEMSAALFVPTEEVTES